MLSKVKSIKFSIFAQSTFRQFLSSFEYLAFDRSQQLCTFETIFRDIPLILDGPPYTQHSLSHSPITHPPTIEVKHLGQLVNASCEGAHCPWSVAQVR